jgi:hypothetical protein
MGKAMQTVLVTGATRGIGWELAELFAARGYNLVVTGRDADRLHQLKVKHSGSISVETIVADLSSPSGVTVVIDKVKRAGISIDILVNNAGFGDHGVFAEADLGKQLAMIQVNIASLVSLTRAILPDMLRRKSGRILNVASTAAFVPGPLMSIYYATKAFVLSFSQAVAFEVRDSGVTVSALCPGATRTDFDATAGTSGIRLVKSGIMEARVVAEAGIRGLMAGKRVIVPGVRNKVSAFASRLAPRGAATQVAWTLNSKT